uniref:Cadherin domain-containing protein n=1 Tax=Cyprinus carpio TaxID=7962 RepID=A0A8C2PWX8_CYPCA
MYILEKIDRENLCTSKSVTTCVLKVDATLENPIRMFNIELEIMDINDNAPSFRRNTMHLDISEATASGERFSLTNAVDPDTGSNSVKTYYLSESDHFSIEIQTGRDGSKFADLILKTSLDREKQASHNLILTAVDGGVPARSGTASIIVRVLDTNDNDPQFDKDSYTINLTENAPIGSLVVKLNATDKDEGTNSDIFYSFSLYTSEKTQETFKSSDNYYELLVSEPLDREKVPEYDITITVTDRGNPPLSDNETITLELLDVNDNVPQFPQTFYTIPVMENNAPGALLSSLTAIDPDLHENQYLVYFIIEKEIVNTSMSMLFSINPENGNLYARQMRLDIRSNKKYLDVNKETGELYILEKIDREFLCSSKTATCFIKMEVTLENPVRMFNIEIEIGDINDNAPRFWRDTIRLDISESTAAGERFSLSNAVDPDIGSNSIKTYYLTQSEHFDIEIQTGRDGSKFADLILKKLLDREKQASHNLILTAVDGGVPARSGTASIILLDVNDNVPQFPQTFYTIPVMENNAPGALLSSLTAIDPDLHENQYLVYFIIEKEIVNTSMSMLFSINPENGNLYALKTFDYEIEKEFLFHIEARDSGVPPLSSNVTVHIIIMDQNDNTPLIVSPWRAHGSVVEEKIPRSTDKGTLIAKVIAIDSDSVHNSRIAYQFLHNTDATLFSLDQYNGEIRTMRMFSYRDSRHQQLVVIAKDNGEPALSATVTIKLSTVETALKTYADMTEVPLEYDIFSDLNLYLVIGLGSVSFLLLITILVTIVLKCQKTKPSKAAPPSRNSVISERNSTIADSTLVSNDAYWYSLFLAETRKGKLVVRQPVPKGARYIVSSIPRSTGLTETSDSAASTLQVRNASL